LGLGGEDGVPFDDAPLDGTAPVAVFFLPVKGRRNDQSDSNCIASYSDGSGQKSRRQKSSSWSILRSANRMMNTVDGMSQRLDKRHKRYFTKNRVDYFFY
jgi:hypothetical protein